RFSRDWSSDVCSSDLDLLQLVLQAQLAKDDVRGQGTGAGGIVKLHGISSVAKTTTDRVYATPGAGQRRPSGGQQNAAVAPLVLGLVQRLVGAAQQPLVVRMAVVHRHADADGELQHLLAQPERLGGDALA